MLIFENLLIAFLVIHVLLHLYYRSRVLKVKLLIKKFELVINNPTEEKALKLIEEMPIIYDLGIQTNRLSNHDKLEEIAFNIRIIYTDLLDHLPFFKNMKRKSKNPLFTLRWILRIPNKVLKYLEIKTSPFWNTVINTLILPILIYFANLFADEIKEIIIELWKRLNS